MRTPHLILFSLLALPLCAQVSQPDKTAGLLHNGKSTTAVPNSAGPASSGTRAEDDPGRYVADVRELLNQERFDRLDHEASSIRAGKLRFSGGSWKLPRFYQAVTEPKGGSEALDADWEGLLTKLQNWRAQQPDSITARVALAETYSHYAWKARGMAYADQVTEEGWRLFKERLRLARDILDGASALSEKCPEWYAAMQTVAMGQSWSKDQAAELFQKAITFEPTYDFYYRAYALYLLPKWSGDDGDSERFAEEISDKIAGQQGDVIYFEIARELRCDCVQNMSWERIQRGYTALEDLYGTSTLRQNQFAYLAFKRKDASVAREQFLRIGDDWDKDTWKTQEYFASVKRWATWMAGRIDVAASGAEANAQTAEGHQYDIQITTVFKDKLTAAIKRCAEQAGRDSGRFDVFVLFTEQGIPQTFLAQPQTAASDCLRPQVQELMYPRPPKPDYWLKINLGNTP